MKLTQDTALPKGKRTYLCMPSIEDQEEFLLAANESTDLHYPWVEAPNDEQKYQQYLKKSNFEANISFLIRHIDNNQLIGVINISEIVHGVFQSGYLGFYAFKRFNGQGLISEGLALVLSFYFTQLKLHRLEANIQPDNLKSINLIKGAKFRLEGFSPKYLKINGQWRDHERYAITTEDYQEILLSSE